MRSRLHTAIIVAGVVATHGAAVWALQRVLTPNATTPPRPVVVNAVLIPRQAAPSPPPQPAPAVRRNRQPAHPALQRPAPPTPPALPPEPTVPDTVATPTQPEPTPIAAAANAASAPVAAAPAAVAPVATPAVPAPPPPARIELPSASAAYLNNPPPPYPPLSRRLGEQGTVMLRVRIEPDGTASAAEVRTSSGYERLDQAALQAVLRWRFVPGTRNGVPEAMWFLIPIRFVLE